MSFTIQYEKEQMELQYNKLIQEISDMDINTAHESPQYHQLESIKQELKRLNAELFLDGIRFAKSENLISSDEEGILLERLLSSKILKRKREEDE